MDVGVASLSRLAPRPLVRLEDLDSRDLPLAELKPLEVLPVEEAEDLVDFEEDALE